MTPPLPILRVLGAPALHGPDGEPITFRTRKHFALLIYLALEPASHRREKLAALLWPNATTSEARHSLSTAISVLRARLGKEAIETTRDTARLVPGSLEIDLDRLARGEIHATETTSALDIAPLLQDVALADAIPWEQWRDALAAKWQPAIREALLARIDRVRRQGNTRAMEVLADALLTLDDLSEDGVRAKMESRAFAGDRLTALQIYEDWRVRLADELGAQPSDLVAGMALRLRRRGWERTSGENIPSVRTDQWKDRPFVGRAKEYEVLYEGWEGCQRGTPRHVLITGESGVGKSTLMERLTTAAGLQGAVSARVQCHEVEREIPYGAIGGLVTMLLDRPGATSVAPEWLGELSRTVSTVKRRFPNAPAPPEATGEMVRIRLADALHELVRAIAEEQPLILVMDDIHLADDASVSVMHLLLRRFTSERALVFCTLRPTDGPLAPSARGMMERADLAGMSIVPLPPLSEAECLELLGHLVPGEVGPPPATVRRALLRAANGLPMLLELLVRDWLGHGDRCVALAVQAMTEEPGTEGGAGETYRRLLERLTLGLDPTTRSVLNLAAVLGSQLNEFELYSLVDLTLAQSMAGLSQLAAIRVLRDSGHGLEFVNEVMRGEVYLAVPSSVRKVLHSKVADRLIERSEGGEEMLGLAIAWHCMRSSRVKEAGEWLIRGGEEAISKSALAEAEAALESGFRHLAGLTKVECGIVLGEVLFDQFRYIDAHALALSVSSLPDAAQSSRLRFLLSLTTIAVTVHDPAKYDQTLTQLLAWVRSDISPEDRLRAGIIAGILASVSLRSAHLRDVLAALLEASTRTTGRTATRLTLLCAQVYYWDRQTDRSEAILRELEHSAATDGPSMLGYNLRLGMGTCRVARGDYSGSLEASTHAIRLAALAGSVSREAIARSNTAVSYFRLGDLGQALHYAQTSRRLLDPREKNNATSVTMSIGVEMACFALEGKRAEFAHALSEARAITETDLGPHISALRHLWIADGLWLIGEEQLACQSALTGLRLYAEPVLCSLGHACRWAAVLYSRNSMPELIATIGAGVRDLARIDLLDRFEVATSALRALALDLTKRSELEAHAKAATLGLPPYAIGYMGRFGLRPALVRQLSQHSHPTA